MTAAGPLDIGVIGGDGIGPEVVGQALKALEALAGAGHLRLRTTSYDLGAARYLASGEVLPDEVLAKLDTHDAILLGAVGDPRVPSGVLERGLLLRLRFALDLAVNLRPVRLYPGVASPLAGVTPADVDLLVVREGTEGPYAGVGGRLRPGTPEEVAVEESLNTAGGVTRVVRAAFARAAARPRRRLTLVHKTNVLTHAGALWSATVAAVAPDYPEVELDYVHVDAAAMYLVSDPGRFDVIVTDNLFGDILTDLGAAIAGGIGLAASANLNLAGAHPSIFEPVHGSAPDIAGRDQADPVAAVLSAALLLESTGHPGLAAALERAVARELRTRSPSSPVRTGACGDRLAAFALAELGAEQPSGPPAD